MDRPVGAGPDRTDRVDFDRRVRLEFRAAQFSPDGGLLVMREIDDTLGLSARAIAFQLAESAVTGPMVRAILAAIRRHQAHDRDPDPNTTKAAGQVCPPC